MGLGKEGGEERGGKGNRRMKKGEREGRGKEGGLCPHRTFCTTSLLSGLRSCSGKVIFVVI